MQVDIGIRVTSEDGSMWNWDIAKFESRLFIMRDLYAVHLDGGNVRAPARRTPLACVSFSRRCVPQVQVPQEEDPFWDPPEPIEIGKAYVYLKALSQVRVGSRQPRTFACPPA